MKNLLPRILPLFVLVFVLAACQKSEELRPNNQYTDDRVVDPTAAIQQDIVFQYAEYDGKGNMNNGWVIMKDGTIRSFEWNEEEWDVSSQSCSVNDMLKLEAAVGDQIGTVDLEALVDNFGKIEAAARFIPILEVHDEAMPSVAFFAYKAVNTNNHESGGDGCSNSDMDGHSAFGSPYFDQVLLSMKGGIEASNESSAAQQIYTWLEHIHEEVYF